MANLEDRLRTVVGRARTASGLSLQELADRTGISASTLSRLETGGRRMTVETLEVLADALGTPVAALVADAEEDDRLLLPTPQVRMDGGMHGVVLRTEADGRQLMRLTVPAGRARHEGRTHPGHEWFHVLRGRVRLVVGERELAVEPGQTVRFNCAEPHSFGGLTGPAEILSRFEPGEHRAP